MREIIIPVADDEYIGKIERIWGINGELIRCRDCKHRPIGGEAYNHTLIFPDECCPCNCVDDNWYSWMPDDNWFCGNGGRKEE